MACPMSVRAGQASLEMTIAFGCALMLLFAGVKIALWSNERLILRQRVFERTRVIAGNQSIPSAQAGPFWRDPTKVTGGIRKDEPCYEMSYFGTRLRPYRNRLHLFEPLVDCAEEEEEP